jgi:hypothetical protein
MARAKFVSGLVDANVRIGFIGAGDISSLHFEGVKKTKGAELVGLWSR